MSPDWNIIWDLIVSLRAERFGKGNGRVYTVSVTCNDAFGISSSGGTNINMPHDKGKPK